MWRVVIALAMAVSLGACLPPTDQRGPDDPFAPEYNGIETRLLDNDLVNFEVEMRNGSAELLEDYARCAAAQYTLIRGYGFTRHVRTLVDDRGGIWRADAVYTVSPALPEGERTIDAEVTVADCLSRGVPTV